jgi:hypothetical protein
VSTDTRSRWSIDDALDECELHIESLRVMLKGIELTPERFDQNVRRTLYYSLAVVKEHRRNLLHVRSVLDSCDLLE